MNLLAFSFFLNLVWAGADAALYPHSGAAISLGCAVINAGVALWLLVLIREEARR